MMLNDTSKIVFKSKNSVKRKFKNKRVTLYEINDDEYEIEVVNLDKKFANEPAVGHQTLRNVVRLSTFRVSRETLEGIIINGIELLGKQTEEDKDE